MSFMKPFIFHGSYVVVETHRGNYIVPIDHALESEDRRWLSQCAPEGIGPIDHTEIDNVVVKIGWFGRMSAPGYMDCTDWESADSEESLLESLEDRYGPFDE